MDHDPRARPGEGSAGALFVPSSGRLAALDQWMALHPWHPRLVPFVVYLLFLPIIATLRDWQLWTYPLSYAAQCLVVSWLLWRYRGLLPELNLRFHWLALPVGLGVCAGWVWIGMEMERLWPSVLADDSGKPHFFVEMEPWLRWPSLGLRLLGMSIVVPLFEDLFVRSLLLRSLHSFRMTGIGVFQFLHDLPVIGEWVMHTELGRRAGRRPPVFGMEFARNALGSLSVFGVAASTLVFMVHHVPRDWAACVMCGVAYCVLLRLTRQKGLGPTVWAHGITNAALWGYTLYAWDWRFL